MSKSNEQIIFSALMKLGISPNIKGFHYITKAITISLNATTPKLNFSRQVYPVIADYFNVTSNSIERAIGNAIKIGYSRGDAEFADSLFSNTLKGKFDTPSNTLFIAVLTNWVRLQ